MSAMFGIPLWVLDQINSLIEFALLLPFLWECYWIFRVKNSVSQNTYSQICYLVYCAWFALYFSQLGQYYSMWAAILWVIAYIFKIFLVIRYREKKL